MNYSWKKVFENKSQSENAIFIFDTNYQEGKIRIILFVTPQMKVFDGNKRVVFSRIYFRTRSNEVSDCLFHAVSDDIFELCDAVYGVETIYKTVFNEYSTVSRFPSYNAFTFGDYSRSV